MSVEVPGSVLIVDKGSPVLYARAAAGRSTIDAALGAAGQTLTSP